MNDSRPHLKAVGTDTKEAVAGADGAAARRSQPEPQNPRRRTWLIAAALGLACLALVIQTRRVGALSSEVTRLSADLVGTRAALVAYEGRLATVREVVGDLSQRLAMLDELVHRDPLAPPEAADSDAPAPDAP